MKLYDYFRSTASYRVRIALNLKGINYESVPIHLVNNGGEQLFESYQTINPQSLVPTLEIEEHTITQSLAIIDYLDESYPSPPLLPQDPILKAKIRSIALSIACEIHPLNNLRVLRYLQQTLHVSDDEKMSWYRHWIQEGFHAIEKQLNQLPRSKPVCVLIEPSLADICLIPQVYNAKRFECDLKQFPIICSINDYCLTLKAFQDASP